MKHSDKVIAAVILGVIFWFIWLFYGYFTKADVNVKASLIGLGTAIIATIITHNYAQKREIRTRHFLEKSKAYMNIFDLIFDVMKKSKQNEEFTEEQMIERSMKIKKSLMVWGSQSVLQSWITYEREAVKNPDSALMNIDNVLREIRKDLGHSDENLGNYILV